MKTKILLGTFLILSANQTYANYEEIANYLADKNIIVNQKHNPANYNLEKNILRQEMAGIIAKVTNTPNKTTCENKFEDVKVTKNNSWACGRIESLLEAGLIASNPKYNPLKNVTKAEALSFVIKAIFHEEYEKYPKKHDKWELNAIDFLKEKDVLEEEIGNYKENAKRGFIFEIMVNAMEEKAEESSPTNTINHGTQDSQVHNDRAKLVNTQAMNWLKKVNGMYYNFNEVMDAATKEFGHSDVKNEINRILMQGEFSYNYKTNTSVNENPQDGGRGVSNFLGERELNGRVNGVISRYESNRDDEGLSDSEMLELVAKKYGTHTWRYKELKFYIESGYNKEALRNYMRNNY